MALLIPPLCNGALRPRLWASSTCTAAVAMGRPARLDACEETPHAPRTSARWTLGTDPAGTDPGPGSGPGTLPRDSGLLDRQARGQSQPTQELETPREESASPDAGFGDAARRRRP